MFVFGSAVLGQRVTERERRMGLACPPHYWGVFVGRDRQERGQTVRQTIPIKTLRTEVHCCEETWVDFLWLLIHLFTHSSELFKRVQPLLIIVNLVPVYPLLLSLAFKTPFCSTYSDGNGMFCSSVVSTLYSLLSTLYVLHLLISFLFLSLFPFLTVFSFLFPPLLPSSKCQIVGNPLKCCINYLFIIERPKDKHILKHHYPCPKYKSSLD